MRTRRMTTVSDGDDPLNAAAARLELQLRGLSCSCAAWEVLLCHGFQT